MDAGDYKKASTCYLIGNVFNKGIVFDSTDFYKNFINV